MHKQKGKGKEGDQEEGVSVKKKEGIGCDWIWSKYITYLKEIAFSKPQTVLLMYVQII